MENNELAIIEETPNGYKVMVGDNKVAYFDKYAEDYAYTLAAKERDLYNRKIHASNGK